MNEDWSHLNEDGEEELGFAGLLVLALVVLGVSWLSFCVAATWLD